MSDPLVVIVVGVERRPCAYVVADTDLDATRLYHWLKRIRHGGRVERELIEMLADLDSALDHMREAA